MTGQDINVTLDEATPINVSITGGVGSSNSIDTLTDTTITAVAGGHILIWDGSNSWDNKAVSGDITLSSEGVVAIATGVIVDADVNASANIDASKLGTGVVSNTEFNYLNGVTSAIQTQLDTKITASSTDTLTNKSGNISQWTNDSGYIAGITAEDLGDLNDVTITSVTANEVIRWSGTAWINSTLSEAGIQATITDTDDLTEGSTNLFHTSERVDDRVAAFIQNGTGISWAHNDVANTLTPTVSLSPFSTTNLSEGTNLYYTDTRFDTRLAAKSTSDLTEGTNLYYTDTRFDDRLATKSTTNLTEGTNLYYTDARFDTRLATKDTGDLAEGSNLYHTDERVDDRVNSLITDGANFSSTYDDGAGTLTMASVLPYVTVSRDSDGDYNCDGTADDVEIQSAIDSLSSGGVVYLKRGTYNITSSIEIPSSVKLVGDGYASQIHRASAIVMINTTGAIDDVHITQLYFDGNGNNEHIIRISTYEANDNVKVDHCHFFDSLNRAFAADGTNIGFFHNKVENCAWGVSMAKHAASTDEHSISIAYNEFSSAQTVADASEFGEMIEVNTHGLCRAIVHGNRFYGTASLEEAIDVNATEYEITSNIIVMNDTETRSSKGISVGVETTADSNGSVANNIILNVPDTAGVGIWLATTKGCMCYGNYIEGESSNGYRAIEVGSASEDLTIFANTIKNFATGFRNFAAGDTTIYAFNRFVGTVTDKYNDSSNQLMYNDEWLGPPRYTGTQINNLTEMSGGAIVHDSTDGINRTYNASTSNWDYMASTPNPLFAFPRPIGSYVESAGGSGLSTPTQAEGGAFQLIQPMDIDKISLDVTAASSAGDIRIGIYDQDGDQLLNETATIGGVGVHTETLSSNLFLNAGLYYIFLQSVGSTNVQIRRYNTNGTLDEITGEPLTSGVITGLTSGVLPSTIDYVNDITADDDEIPIFRLD